MGIRRNFSRGSISTFRLFFSGFNANGRSHNALKFLVQIFRGGKCQFCPLRTSMILTLKMRSVTWCRLSIKNLALRDIDFLLKIFVDGFKIVALVETSYLNTDVCKFESLQKGKSRTIGWFLESLQQTQSF